MHEVAAIDALGGGVELLHGGSDVAAQAPRRPQRDRLDQRKQDAQRDQAVADVAGDDAAQRAAEQLAVQQRWPRMHHNGDAVAVAGIPVRDVHGGEKRHAKVAEVDGRWLNAAVDRGVVRRRSCQRTAAQQRGPPVIRPESRTRPRPSATTSIRASSTGRLVITVNVPLPSTRRWSMATR